jgi:hypothetical protein
VSSSNPGNFSEQSTFELFALHRAVLGELRTRGVVRTDNNPAGDYAEYLVAAALNAKLSPNSEKSWDMVEPGGRCIQVKSRVVSDPPRSGQLQLGVIRSFEFDDLVIVLLDERDLTVRRAVRIVVDVVRELGGYSGHVNGFNVHARPSLLNDPRVTDITETLRRFDRAQPPSTDM